MPLTGEAKKIYQRDYMRKRRSVSPDVRPFGMLDRTLKDCIDGLDNVNNNLEKAVETMRKKREYARKPKAEHTNLPQNVKLGVCPICNDTGSIALDKIGLVSKFCTCEAGKALRERVEG